MKKNAHYAFHHLIIHQRLSPSMYKDPHPPLFPPASLQHIQNQRLQEHLPGVLNVLLDLDQERDSFPAVEQSMIVCERKVHHRPDFDFSVNSNGLVFDSVQTKNSGLREVNDRSTHQTAEDPAVGDGEGTTGHVLNGELVVARLLAEIGNRLLNANHVQALSISNDGGNETLLGSDGNGYVDVVAVDDGVAAVGTLNRSIDSGYVACGEDAGAREGGHETKLDALVLEDLVFVELAELHDGGHVDFVEGGQGGGGVLRLLQALGDAEAHAVHLDLYMLLVGVAHIGVCRRTRRSSRLPGVAGLGSSFGFDSFLGG
jgi:hypothetical protein